jgi:plastocyanin
LSSNLIRVKTNKDQYVSGESVNISGTVSPIVSTNIVDIQIYDPEKKPYRHEAVPVRKDSSYDLDLRLGSKVDMSGTYGIAVSSGKESAHTKFSYSNDEFGDKVVVIPDGSHNETSGKSFQPPIIIAQQNNTITWINQDSISHTATSGNPQTHKADGKFDTGFIPPGESKTIIITNTDEQLVSYFCGLHPWEKGVVSTNPQIKEVFIREDLRLSESIDIKVTRADEILEAHKQLAKLERHFSNDQIQTLKFEELAIPKDRLLTIVFWDIGKFSELSENLKGNQNLLVEFLQEFYSRVTEIIFRNGGSLDKFVGDGAMAIFGIVSR